MLTPGRRFRPPRKTPKSMKIVSKKFESLGIMSAFIANNAPCGYWARLEASELGSNSPAGRGCDQGTDSLEAANELMIHGWQDGAARVKAAMIQAAGASSSRPRCYNSVVGFAPNVPNYIMGHPLNMINKKRARVPARVVDIVYNCAVDSKVEAKRVEAAAAKLFNVVAGLEASGVRVNLWVMMASDGRKECCSIAVKIKTASQPFNLLKMVYPVVHPSFLRRQCLAVMERVGLSKSGRWGFYGAPISDNKTQKECAVAAGIKSDNIFSYYTISGKTEKQIAEMIK